MERAAQVWDVFGEKELFRARVSGMGGTVISAAFGPESDLLAVSAGDGPVELWDANTGKRLQTLLGRRGQGIKVAISTDGKTVASVDSTYDIQRWRTDGTPLGITKAPQEFMQVPISGLAFADKERVVGWATAAQFAIAWEAPSSKRLSPQMDHCAAIRTIAFPRDDKGALKEPLTSGNDGRCFRWDLATGSIGEEILFHPSRLPGEAPLRPVISLSPDGKYGYWQRPHVEIFDIPAGDDKFGIPPPTVPLSKSGFVVRQAAGKIVASSSQSPGKTTGTAVVWDVDRQKRVGEYDTPGSFDGSVPPSVMSPDGKWLVVSALTRNPQGRFAITFAPIELKTGKRLPHVDDDTIGVGRMGYAYLGDTSVLLTSSMGRLWTFDFKTGKVGPDLDTIVPRGEPPFGSEVAISPDGKLAAIGIVDEPFTRYGVRVYDWRNRKILATFVGHLGPVSTLHFSPDGSLLASGSQDTSVLLWDLRKLAKE
jgi:WD40 repeat protein